MSKDRNLVEETLIQMKNLEEAVAENAKGILASTMGQEIKELVKESITESEEDEEKDEIETEVDTEVSDDSSDEDDEMGMDDMDMDKSTDSEEVIDLRGKSDSQVLKVFQLMDDDDEVVVTKDESDNIHLKDGEKEYMIVQEGDETYESDLEETDMYGDMDDESEFDMKKSPMMEIGRAHV